MLTLSGYIIIITFCGLLFGIVLLLLIKATTHFNYLKEIYPEELGRYNTLFDLHSFNPFSDNHNYIFLLFFPTFDRDVAANGNEHLIKMEKRIKNICKTIYILILSLIAFVTILIVFFREK